MCSSQRPTEGADSVDERSWDEPPRADHPESGDLTVANGLMQTYDWGSKKAIAFVDGIHAAERRATVERIQRKVDAVIEEEDRDEEYLWAMLAVRAILDEEAAR
jgi:hypothetical protein